MLILKRLKESFKNNFERDWLESRGIRLKILRDEFEGDVVEEYEVGLATVKIVESNFYYYIVSEPELNDREVEAYYKVMYKLYFSLKSDPKRAVKCVLRSIENENNVDPEKVSYYVLRDTLGYGVLDTFIKDDEVEDISVDGMGRPLRVFHRRFSDLGWLFTNLKFENEEELDKYATLLAYKGGKSVNVAFPVAEGLLPEKYRVMVTYRYEVSPLGSSFVIRKPFKEPLTLPWLIHLRMLSPLMASYLWTLLELKGAIFITGEMASGKTTLLNAILMFLPPNWKILTIESSPEIFLPHPGWKPLVTRFSVSVNHTPIPEYSLFDLVRVALRERADVIVIGEVRGEEARYLAQAIATGHSGATTFHSDSIDSMVSRLVSPPIEMSRIFLPLISSAVTRYVKIPRRKPLRRVIKVGEIMNEDGEYIEVFEWRAEEDEFEPNDASDIVKRSVKLVDRAKVVGWSKRDLIEEIESRREFIEGLVKRRVFKFADVVNEVQRFFR